MKLSILIPTVHTRRKTFLPVILESIYDQYNNLPEDKKKEVEILTYMDNKTVMLGYKRNVMVDNAQGEYVVFVDDDDRVAPDYIEELLQATYSDADVITFKAEVTINGEDKKICYYSSEYRKDFNSDTEYFRIPNHICAVKRSVASKVEFPSVLYGEDSGYSKLLKPLLNTEHKLDKILYYYDFNTETTETQLYMRGKKEFKRENVPALVDLIILSNAKDEEFRQMTQNTIDTALENSKEYKLNIIVMEQNIEVSYIDTKTIHYDIDFNYNKLANLGAQSGTAPYIMIANNDLLFKQNWLLELFKTEYGVVSPKCPKDIRQKDFTENTTGYETAKHFSGWCFMIKRSIWEQIGGFDEDFSFWFADNAVVKQLEAINYPPMVVPSSLVEHLGSKTLNTLGRNEKHEKTYAQAEKFNAKYDERHFR